MLIVSYADGSTKSFEDMTLELVCASIDNSKIVSKIINGDEFDKELNAFVRAKDAKDPDWEMMRKYTNLRKQYKNKIIKKYGN